MKIFRRGPLRTEISSRQFPAVERPSWIDSLKWPEDITSLGPANLSELLGRYTALYAYACFVAAEATEADLCLQSQELLRRGTVFRQNPSVNGQARWKRDAYLITDAALEGVAISRGRHRIKAEWAKAYQAIYDRYIQALSRELTRRTTHQV